MKYDNELNLFWAIVWAVVFALAVVGFFWKPAIVGTAIIGGFFTGLFVADFIKVKRMK